MALPKTATAQVLFNNVATQGGIGLDHSAVVLALEKMANHLSLEQHFYLSGEVHWKI